MKCSILISLYFDCWYNFYHGLDLLQGFRVEESSPSFTTCVQMWNLFGHVESKPMIDVDCHLLLFQVD